MLSKDERGKRKLLITNAPHILQQFHERGRKLFNKESVQEMLLEVQEHFYNPNRSVVVKDERPNVKSTEIVMFLSDAGNLVAIPCIITESHFNILTLLDPVEAINNPNWFIGKYNEIGIQRGMQRLPLKIRVTR